MLRGPSLPERTQPQLKRLVRPSKVPAFRCERQRYAAGGPTSSSAATPSWTATTLLSDRDDVDVLRVRRQGFQIVGVGCDYGPTWFS